MSEQEQDTQLDPDPEAGPAVDPVDPNATDDVNPDAVPGDQGESVGIPAAAAGFDPSRPVRTSAQPPEAQSGTPLPGEPAPEPEAAPESPSDGEGSQPRW